MFVFIATVVFQCPPSTPISFWTEQDILQYIKEYNLNYASVYGDIILKNGKYKTTGENRTGCVFCAYGICLEEEDRFERLSKTHPNLHKYCMETLGFKNVLEYIRINEFK